MAGMEQGLFYFAGFVLLVLAAWAGTAIGFWMFAPA